MKMRGYSVLFVCALCVFVLCGAAVVVAQDVTPEKRAAEELKATADTAKEKGQTALSDCKKFESNVNYAVDRMNLAITKLIEAKKLARNIDEPGSPPKEVIEKEIEKLETGTTGAKAAVEALAADAVKLKNQISQNYEPEKKMKDVESAAITKAGDLQTAAEAARDLWAAVVREFTTQLDKGETAVAAVKTAKDDIDKAHLSFAGHRGAKAVNDALTNVAHAMLTPALENISGLQTALQSVKRVSEEARKQYDELAKKAAELQENAGERSHMGQNRGKGNKNEGPISTATSQPSAANSTLTGAPASEKADYYGAGPLCSLALPAFFFCWCVLFGM